MVPPGRLAGRAERRKFRGKIDRFRNRGWATESSLADSAREPEVAAGRTGRGSAAEERFGALFHPQGDLRDFED
jgi:hypothetical protein